MWSGLKQCAVRFRPSATPPVLSWVFQGGLGYINLFTCLHECITGLPSNLTWSPAAYYDVILVGRPFHNYQWMMSSLKQLLSFSGKSPKSPLVHVHVAHLLTVVNCMYMYMYMCTYCVKRCGVVHSVYMYMCMYDEKA